MDDTMRRTRLLVSAGVAVALAALAVTMLVKEKDATLVIAAFLIAVQNVMAQIPTERAVVDAGAAKEEAHATKQEMRANTAITAQAAATTTAIAEEAGVRLPSPAHVQDLLEKSLPRPNCPP
jgi:uncharacterized membrane protein YeiB